MCRIAAAATALLIIISACAGLVIHPASAIKAIRPFQVLRSERRLFIYFICILPHLGGLGSKCIATPTVLLLLFRK